MSMTTATVEYKSEIDEKYNQIKNKPLATGMQSIVANPSKVIIPTYKHFRSIQEHNTGSSTPINSSNSTIIAFEYQLLTHEINDRYLQYFNYNKSLFITICVSAINKLGRSIGARGQLFRNLKKELQSVIKREMQLMLNAQMEYYHRMYAADNEMNDDQSQLLLDVCLNIFKIFVKILGNHSIVIKVFQQTRNPYSSNKNRKHRLSFFLY